jgi:hypothetical protein
MEEYRTWRLCKLMSCRPSELDEESAINLDWLLAIDAMYEELKAEKERESLG